MLLLPLQTMFVFGWGEIFYYFAEGYVFIVYVNFFHRDFLKIEFWYLTQTNASIFHVVGDILLKTFILEDTTAAANSWQNVQLKYPCYDQRNRE